MAADLSQLDPRRAWEPFEPDAEQPWNRQRAAHLYRRAGFAANTSQLDEAIKQKPAEAVEQLFRPASVERFESEISGIGRTILAGRNTQNLPAWWLYRMLRTPDQLTEKLTLFWHGHFATSAAKVNDAAAVLEQNQLLRRFALGNFGQLVQAISGDPAMLVYLDSTTNRKTRPNENYARELMELFCLGPGNYTEHDIQEIARCFTGWEVQRGRFRFDPYQHDKGSKSFLNHVGAYAGEDAVRIILEQPAAPRFIAGKLASYLVFDEPQAPPALLEPLAEELRASGFDLAPTVRRILGSRLFFSEHALGRKVRSPVELAVGLLRALEGQTDLYRLADALGELGQLPFYPPNVKGWDGGRTWLNSATLLGRANLVRQLVQGGQTSFAEGDLQRLASSHGVKTPEQIVSWLCELLIAVPLPDGVRGGLLELAASKQGSPHLRLANVVHAISILPEFHLS